MISSRSFIGSVTLAKLGTIVEFLDHKRRPVTESDRGEGAFPYYGANGKQGTIDDFIFDEPLILLAEDGGHFDEPDRGVAYAISGKSWVNNHAHVLRPRKGVDLRYLCRVLENYDLRSFVAGTTRGKLTKAGASEILVPVPPIEEQRRIAAILDKADALRQKRRLALQRLDSLTQSIFLDMFGDPSSNSKDMPIHPLGKSLVFVTSGGRGWAKYYSEAGSRFIRSLDVRMNFISETDLAFVDPPENAEARRTRVQRGDVLLTITGSRIGRVSSVPPDLEGAYISQHVAILRLDKKKLNPVFLSFFLSLNSGGQRQIASAQYGQSKPGLNFEQIRRFRVFAPPSREQEEFVSRIQDVERLKHQVANSAIQIETMFASLQHRAFCGEL